MPRRHRFRRGALIGLLVIALAPPAFSDEDAPPFPDCRVVPLPGHRVAFFHGERQVLGWHHDPSAPNPFIFPLISPEGSKLTRMGHPGAPNHDHHRSIWFSHHDVEGVNFWSDGGPGKIRQKQWLVMEDGVGEALLAVRLGWFDAGGRELLEQDVVLAWRPGSDAGHELELQLDFRRGSGAPEEGVALGQTNFGFLGIRVSRELSGHFGRGRLLDSEGREGEPAIFGKRARWMDYSAPTPRVPEGLEGITCIDHADNPGHPVAWHVREDGWMGPGATRSGGRTLKRGERLRLRYLILAHSSPFQPESVERVAREFHARGPFTILKSRRPHRQFELKRETLKTETPRGDS